MALRAIKILWLLLCVVIAGWGVFERSDGALIATYLLGLLTMPTGLLIYVLSALVIGVFAKENPNFGLTYNLASSLIVYSVTILAGYVQWFILLPKIIRRIRKEKSPAVWSLVIVGVLAILYGLYSFYVHVFPNYSSV